MKMNSEMPTALMLLQAASAPTAVLAFSANQILVRYQGDLEHFGVVLPIDEPRLAEDVLPVLLGLDIRQRKSLEMIALGTGVPADVHVFPREDGCDVLLVDVSHAWSRQQPLQQRLNDSLIASEMQRCVESRSHRHQVARLAHEIRNPLFNISGYCDWLLETVPLSAGIDPQLRIINSNSRYLLELLDRLLESEPDQDSSRHVSSPLDIGELLREIMDLFAQEANAKKIGLNIYLNACDSARPMVDRTRLKQALLNLVGNAVKFTASGFVSLEARRVDDALIITIEDTGSGIPRDELESVLQPFFRARNATDVLGVGIGLSVVNEIARELGGELRIASVESWGTTVVLSVPCRFVEVPELDRAAVQSSRFEALEPNGDGAERCRVLLIDDDEDIQRLLEFYLLGTSYDPISLTPTDLDQIMAQYHRVEPDLVVVDRHLIGDLSGLEVARRIRAERLELPVLMLTSDVSDELRDRAIASGCTLIINKPVNKGRFIEALNAALGPVGRD
ncbi:MAG: ATP-binding protein [Thiotrichales bacterium]